MRDRNRAGWDRVGLLADLETMGAAPAPPPPALQRGVRAVAATPRAGVARRGGGGARGRGLGVLALCAASELLHEHPPLLVHAVVVRAQLERLASVVEETGATGV